MGISHAMWTASICYCAQADLHGCDFEISKNAHVTIFFQSLAQTELCSLRGFDISNARIGCAGKHPIAEFDIYKNIAICQIKSIAPYPPVPMVVPLALILLLFVVFVSKKWIARRA